jgi:Type II secretion system (T2SS), protein E, N-terminal domain
MKHEGTANRAPTYITTSASERCGCPPLSHLHQQLWHEQEAAENSGQIVPVTQALNNHMRAALSTLFPRSTPISVLLFHISQREYIHIAPKSNILHKRQRYHAPASFLEQLLVNIKRTIRATDQVLIHEGTGAAIIFPDVDQEGAYNIVERVYHSINLLQAETVIPPLKRETDILLGMGSYPKPGSTFEDLLYHTGLTARHLTLRPAVTPQLRPVKSNNLAEEILLGHRQDNNDSTLLNQARTTGIPFMQLPRELPQRLKQLIPYNLALELRCAPVGRDHNRLTVAMADPTNAGTIKRLHTATGLSIFPVSCDVAALDMLLAKGW